MSKCTENCRFRQPHCRLMPPLQGTPANCEQPTCAFTNSKHVQFPNFRPNSSSAVVSSLAIQFRPSDESTCRGDGVVASRQRRELAFKHHGLRRLTAYFMAMRKFFKLNFMRWLPLCTSMRTHMRTYVRRKHKIEFAHHANLRSSLTLENMTEACIIPWGMNYIGLTW